MQITRALAHVGDFRASDQVCRLLAERTDLDELRAHADACESWAAMG